MSSPKLYHTLADVVLITHVGFVAFVVLGLGLIIVGGFCGWKWIRNPWFRMIHLAAIGVVTLQSWFGITCPLTVLEMTLRERAGDASYHTSFISHWLQRLLFYEAPAWVFAASYTLFGLLVVASWFKFRPRRFNSSKTNR